MGGEIRSSFRRLDWESSRNCWTKWSELQRRSLTKARSPSAGLFTRDYLSTPFRDGINGVLSLRPSRRRASIDFPRDAHCFAQSDPWGVAPKPLQIVMLTDVGTHHVHNDVEKIQHHPGGLQRAIHGARTEGVFFA